MFGLKYLRGYIGEITFFARFPRMMDIDPPRDISSICATEGWPVTLCSSEILYYITTSEDGLLARSPMLSSANWVMRYNLPRGSQQSDAAQLDARHKTLLPLWQRWCQTPLPGYGAPRWLPDERRRAECELKSISQTLGAELLKYIRATFLNAVFELIDAARMPASIDYDKSAHAYEVISSSPCLEYHM
ncbi:hypothetical protein BKA83DRAFT_4276720 [Pisolithus microcarpus]|nr:hypothetical protein BKA83DRAFT_4276720 [Pisolithus microcarpus]